MSLFVAGADWPGSTLQLTFPLGSSGMTHSGTSMLGTMCAGSRSLRLATTALGSTAAGV